MRKKIDIWKNSEVSSKTPHCPSDSQLNSMHSACDHLPTLAKDFFAKEVFGVPQTLNVNAESMYHGSKSDILKIFAPYSIDSLPASESDSAIIIEMSPIIRGKCCTCRDIVCFSDFAVLIYYEVINIIA